MAGQGDKYSNFVEFTLADLFRSLLLGVRCNQARLARFVVNTRTGMIYLGVSLCLERTLRLRLKLQIRLILGRRLPLNSDNNFSESFKLGGAAESIASSQVELDELDEMSVTDASEKAQLMRKLKEHQEMQKQIQEEMDTQSLATTVPPLPSQVSFGV